MSGLQGLDNQAALDIAKSLENSDNAQIINGVAQIYVQSEDPKYLPFFEKNMQEVDGYGAISFIENYAALALLGDQPTMEKAAMKLKEMGTNMDESEWRRFASIKSLNDMHQNIFNRTAQSADDAEKEKWSAFDVQLVEMINAIKAAETNDQLKQFYFAFPNPQIKP